MRAPSTKSSSLTVVDDWKKTQRDIWHKNT